MTFAVADSRLFPLITLLIAIGTSASASAQTTADREGFTFLVDAGFGIQHDRYYGDTELGIGGINVGAGTFLNPNLALLVRHVGTTVRYDSLFGGYRQFSGTIGVSLQRWLSDRLSVEAGGGLGYWWDRVNFSSPRFGAIAGAGYTLLSRGPHHVQAGVQYAPAFTSPGSVHSISVTVGYQRF